MRQVLTIRGKYASDSPQKGDEITIDVFGLGLCLVRILERKFLDDPSLKDDYEYTAEVVKEL